MKARNWLALIALVASPAAMADISLTLLGGLNFHSPDTAGDVEAEPKLSYGGLVGFGTPWAYSIETGLLFVDKEFKVGGATIGYDAWEVPLLLKYNFTSAISVGAGGYYQIHDEDDLADTDSNDYGLKASARAGFPIVPAFKLVLEGQYNWGLKDMRPGAGEFKNREFLAFGGLMFGF